MGSIQSENTAMVFYDSIINRLWNFFHQSRYHCDRRPIEGRWEATWPGFTGFYRVFSLSHFISSTFCAKLKLIGRSPHEITGFLPSFVMRKHFPKKHLTGFYRVFFSKVDLNRKIPLGNLLSFTEFTCASFTEMLIGDTRFERVLMRFTKKMSFTEFLIRFTKFYRGLPSFTEFYLVLPSFTEF